MQNSIHFLLDLLRGQIITSTGAIVPVIKRSYPLDMSPCICLDDSGGASVIQKYRVHRPYEELHDRVQSYVNIHLYCDKEDERDYLLDCIRGQFFKLEADHYSLCCNLGANNTCNTLEAKCPAIEGTRLRASKNQCPNPTSNEYQNLYTKHNVIRDSLNVDYPFSTDDLTKHPPLLHSVIKTSMIYDTKYTVPGTLSNNLTNKL